MVYNLHPSIERKMNRAILSSLLPIMESWSGQKLTKYGRVYGRRYLRGASMLMHLDNKQRNLFGAILQVLSIIQVNFKYSNKMMA